MPLLLRLFVRDSQDRRDRLGASIDERKACDKGARMPRLASPPTAPAASAERPGEAKDGVKVYLIFGEAIPNPARTISTKGFPVL